MTARSVHAHSKLSWIHGKEFVFLIPLFFRCSIPPPFPPPQITIVTSDVLPSSAAITIMVTCILGLKNCKITLCCACPVLYNDLFSLHIAPPPIAMSFYTHVPSSHSISAETYRPGLSRPFFVQVASQLWFRQYNWFWVQICVSCSGSGGACILGAIHPHIPFASNAWFLFSWGWWGTVDGGHYDMEYGPILLADQPGIICTVPHRVGFQDVLHNAYHILSHVKNIEK